MPRYCCIPNCTSNRPGKEYVTCFRFPKSKDLNELWRKKIPRDFEIKADSVVCAKHFAETDVIRNETFTLKDGSTITNTRKIPKLRDGAYPCIFPNCPSYMSESSLQRTATLERFEKMRKLDDQDVNEWIEKDKVNSFQTLIHELENKNSKVLPFILGNEIVLHVCNECVSFLFIVCAPSSSCNVTKSLRIDKNLTISFFFRDKLYDGETFFDLFHISSKLTCWSQLENVLNFVKCYNIEAKESPKTYLIKAIENWSLHVENECNSEKFDSSKFLLEQMKILAKPLHGRRYSTDLLIFAYCIYIKSAAVYKYLYASKLISIPSLRHLKKLSSDIKVTSGICTNENFSFLKGRCNSLSENERTVNLLIDEIYIKPCITFKSQTITGFTENKKDCATTIQAFMFSSIFSKAKEIVALVPVFKLTASELHELSLKVLQMLETIGFTVLTIISDNNRVNRNMFLKLCGGNEMKVCIPNPFNPSKKLFLLFDSVHLIKSIRNNWLNQKDVDKKFIFPNPKIVFNSDGLNLDSYAFNIGHASFSLLRNIYQEESKSLLKLAPKLSLKALNPTNLERQNVSLALKVFDISNVCTLKLLKEKKNCCNPVYEQTACFIETIIGWWEIMNVKTPYKGQRLRLHNCEPITSNDQKSLEFLQSFASWIKSWDDMKQKNREGGLSRETFFALYHSTLCMISISKYLLFELNVPYVLCGKFQTDNLEARFGQYREMSGSNYYISVQEILESEKKLRVKSLLKVKSDKYGNFTISDLIYSHCFENDSLTDDTYIDKFLPILDIIDFDNLSKNDLKVLTFVSGYCAYKLAVLCENCVQYFLSTKDMILNEESLEHLEYLKMLDRGGLKIPSRELIMVLSVCYEVFQILVSSRFESDFLNCKNQVMVVVKLTIFSLENFDLVNLDEVCSCCGNSYEFYVKKIIRTFSNICLNNYVKLCNSNQKAQKDDRKLKKLQNS